MATIAVTTSQNIDLDFELASLGERILGRLMDSVILLAFVFILFLLIGFSHLGDFLQHNILLVVLLILPILAYDLICEVFFNGQSIGKRVTGIRVISLDGEKPALSQFLIRWLFRLIDFTFSGELLAVIMVAATPEHQRLGDKVAHTVVIRTTPRTTFHPSLSMPPAADVSYSPTYPEVIRLSDADIQIIREVVQAIRRRGNPMLALEAMQRIEKVLQIKSQTDPLPFLQTILTDYYQLTSR